MDVSTFSVPRSTQSVGAKSGTRQGLLGASLLLVYVGQATDFPDLTHLLVRAGDPVVEAPERASPAAGESHSGGDELLDYEPLKQEGCVPCVPEE